MIKKSQFPTGGTSAGLVSLKYCGDRFALPRSNTMNRAVIVREGYSLSSVRSFGIGCLPFELPHSMTEATHWPDFTKRALLALPSVSDVEVRADALELGRMKFPDPDLLEGDDNARKLFWPEPSDATIDFNIHIPARLQKELFPWTGSFELKCENFHVRTVYGWFGPCTFVSCEDGFDSDIGRASGAVALVREFLRKEMKPENGLRMGCVGPSPFHVEANLKEGLGRKFKVNRPIEFEQMGVRGYTDYEFFYDSSVITNLDDAERILQRALSEELQLFYRLTRMSGQRARTSKEIKTKASALIEKNRATGFRASFVRLFKSGSSARALGLDVLEAQLEASKHLSFANEHIPSVAAQSKCLNAFGADLQEAAKEETLPRTQNAMEVVSFVESIRGVEFQGLLIASSSLIGGLAGAFIVALTKH